MNTVLLLPVLFASDGGIQRILRLYVRAVGELTPLPGQVHTLVLNDTAGQLTTGCLRPYATPALTAPIGCGRNKLACAWHMIRLGRLSQRVICGHINLLRVAHLARLFSRGLEVWLVAHGLEVWRKFSVSEQRALCATHRILCVSDYTRGQLLENCPGLSRAQLVIQPNALDPAFERTLSTHAPSVPGLILSVARLNAAESYKGIDHLIAAMPAIRSAIPHARLRVVGDGDDRARLEALATASAANDAIEFTGRVSDETLYTHFEAAHLFALPSRGEGFGLVYLEAMAHGKPCLVADAGGAPEVISAASGVLANYGDVRDIAGVAIAALRRDWSSESIRARARKFTYPAFKARMSTLLMS
ncbi:MAG: glycosyltransferase family 1 protein [Opitutus sp.]|nr:glycosyltransferase family 1 protein [Opitutus sp.]